MTTAAAASPAYAGRDRRRARPSALAIAVAAAGLSAIAFATLCPIGLRPHLAGANVERFCAYLGLGLLVSRAAGRKALTATLGVIALAIALEAAQRLVPGRHAALPDAAIKALGGVLGVAAHQLSFPFKRWLARAGAPNVAPTPHPALSPAPVRTR